MSNLVIYNNRQVPDFWARACGEAQVTPPTWFTHPDDEWWNREHVPDIVRVKINGSTYPISNGIDLAHQLENGGVIVA